MSDAKKKEEGITADQMREMLAYHQPSYASAVPNMSFGAPAPMPVAAPTNAASDYLSGAMGTPRLPSAVTPAAAPVAPAAPDVMQTPDAPPLGAPPVTPDAPNLGSSTHPIDLMSRLFSEYNQTKRNKETANAGIQDATELGILGEGETAKGEMALNDAKAAEANDRAPIDKENEDIAAQNQKRVADIQAAGEAAGKAQMIRVNAAANEAANAHIHNFWEDKSAGGRIMGILAQALSGAANGLAGNPSAPTPLDRIIERDIQSQLQNMENKRAAVGQEQSTMRLVYEQTGNRLAAQTAMTLAAYDRTKAMSQTLADKYATPKAKAENDKIQGALDTKASALQEKTEQFLSQQHASQQMGLLGKLTELDNTDRTVAGRVAAKSGGETEPAPPGTTLRQGARMDKTVYAAVQKQTNGLVSFLAQSDKAADLWTQPLTSENYQAFATTMSLMLTDVRQFEGTGAALSPAEEKNMQEMLVKYRQGIYPLPDEITAARNAVARVQAAATRMYIGRIHGTGAPVDLNPNDPVMGRHIQNYMLEEDAIRSRQK